MENRNSEGNSLSSAATVSYARVLGKLISKWYLVLVSVLLTISIAFVVNRYSTKIYPISASILIRESQEIGDQAELLYNNPLVNQYRNFYNEIYLLKSIPLVSSAVMDTDLMISVRSVGEIMTKEQFRFFPGQIVVFADSLNPSFDGSYDLTFTKDNVILKNEVKTINGQYGDTLNMNGCFLSFHISDTVTALNQIFVTDYKLTLDDPDKVASKYISKIKVEWAEEGSSVIFINSSSASPLKEIAFLDTLISNYQDYDLQVKNKAADQSIKFIQEQLDQISDSLIRIETQLELFKNNNLIAGVEPEITRLMLKIESLEEKRLQILISRKYYQYLIDYLQSNNSYDNIVLPSTVGVEDPILSQLVVQLVDLQLQQKLVDRQLDAENPIASLQGSRIDDVKSTIIRSIENLQETVDLRESELERELAKYDLQLNQLPGIERRLVTIQRKYKLSENLFIFLSQKKAEAEISRSSTTSDIQIINPPRLSGEAILPNTKLIYILALGTGFLIPLLIFYLQEAFNNRVQSRQDVEELSTIPFLGVIGHKELQENLVVHNKPKSSISESFRSLRSNLSYFLPSDQSTKIVLITSSIAGEGKTFTAVNLGNVISLTGKRCLIIGADMRKPKIFDDFQLDNSVGLSSYLAGETQDLKEVIQSTFIENLYLISGGPIPPNPHELLMQEDFKKLIEDLRSDFDYILIDSPPLGIVADAFELIDFADHVITIIRQDYTQKSSIALLDGIYRNGKTQSISLILNDVHKSGLGYGVNYGYGYSYGYGYYDDDKEKRPAWKFWKK